MSDELPEGWAAVPLGKLVRPSKEKAEPGTANGRPYLGMEHVEAETGRVLGHGDAKDVRSTTVAYRAGDVLYGKLRPYLNKVTVAPFDGVGSTEFIVFAQHAHLDSRYLRWLLARREFVEIANERAVGVQLPRVTFDKLADLEQPLPPLAEQRRIVAKVETLLEQVRRAKDRLDRVPLILKRFRQAVLAAACSGALSTNGGSREDDPRPWLDTTLGDLLHSLTSGSRGWASYYADSGPLFIRSQDINKDRLDLSEIAHVCPPENQAERGRTRAKRGDLLLTITGANVTKAALIDQEIPETYISQHVAMLRLKDASHGPFLHLWLTSPAHGRGTLLDAAYGAGRPGLNLEQVKAVPVALPDADERERILSRVQALLALATSIEQRVERAAARAGSLPQAILLKAFAGELVPTEAEIARAEGRDYETAEQLIERVRAQSADPTATEKRPRSASPRGRSRTTSSK